MTKAKATKLDTEIKEALFDPKKSISQVTAKEWNTKKKHGYTLIKNGQKYILKMDKGKTILEPVKVYDPKKKYHSLMEYIFREDNTKGFSYTELERLNHELWDEIAHRKELMDSNKAYWDAIFKFADKKGIKHTRDKFKGETFYAPLVYDPLTDIVKREFTVVSKAPKNGFLLNDGTFLSLSEHADILQSRLHLNQNQFMKRTGAMRVESYRDEYINVEIDVHTTPSLAQWNALSKFPKIFYDFTDGKTVVGHGIVFTIGDLKSEWMKDQKRPYDPKHKTLFNRVVEIFKTGKEFSKEPRAELYRIKEKIGKSKYTDAMRQGLDLRYPSTKKGKEPEMMLVHYDLKTLSVPSRWYEAMVRGIKKSSDVRNPYAIVKSIWSKLSPSKKAEIKAREKKGERFKYDLPLPVDKPTKGTGTVRMVKPFKLAEVQVNLSIKDYLAARASGLFQRMKRGDGTTALVARCKAKTPQDKNVNIFVDRMS